MNANIDWDLVNDLNERAEFFDMEVDWETQTLTPKIKPRYNHFDMSEADHMAIDEQGWE